ncbi:DUF2238 domain-containing protein [Brevibacillus migulae]|uniref:DUF2238 domain-containing protein n=1 Tax=Brevibacillus migulae TaxID=1644114 RepID=UPI00106E68F4|nr:DUF2238 domain-containing protein [Brevibacillus migulae]
MMIQTFGHNRKLQLMLAAFAVFWIWMAINPVHRSNWLLENLLVFAAVIVFSLTYRQFAFSNASYGQLLLFMSLHTLGAHYTYATTPVDVWLHGLFDFERNHYDRVVHFSFGLLLAYPAYEFLSRLIRVNGIWAYVLAVITILSAGAFYELIEMWVAKIVAPEIGTMFLGTQGDEWDAQQDMAVALYGAAISMVTTAILHQIKKHSLQKVSDQTYL